MDGVVNSGSIPALDSMLSFLSARLDMIAENVANADTVGYRTKQLDTAAFQNALARAVRQRDPTPGSPLPFRSHAEFRQEPGGKLLFTPSHLPQENILFHDRSDMRIESQMKDLAETVMMHQAVIELLRGQYGALKKAIKGEVV
jgi:flagellar basal-body rod protein FlgB